MSHENPKLSNLTHRHIRATPCSTLCPSAYRTYHWTLSGMINSAICRGCGGEVRLGKDSRLGLVRLGEVRLGEVGFGLG